MRRGSRKKQQQDAASRVQESQHHPVTAAGVTATKRQQRPQEVLQHQQQKKKHLDDIASLTAKNSSLTTKNYRLAKELAELRRRHRDESRNVTRLTMENMNLASRCREAISHVAMLKKELAMQQKRTVQALASQREQNQRMTNSLTSSFISNSSNSPDITDSASKLISQSCRVSDASDDNVLRLVSNTSSPSCTNIILNQDIIDDESKPIISGTKSETLTMTSSPTEELRDSPATTVTASPKIEMESFSNFDEYDSMVDGIKLNISSFNESNLGEELKDVEDNEKNKTPALCSTPKCSGEQSFSSNFLSESDSDLNDEEKETETRTGIGLFPFAASPNAFKSCHSNSDNSSYDEQYPFDVIDDSDADVISGSHGINSHQKKKMNLMNSIDAFEMSFSTDFPDSFTQIESSNNALNEGLEHTIYNPFLTTPEKRKEKQDKHLPEVFDDGRSVAHLKTNSGEFTYCTPSKDEMENERFSINCVTPPKNESENKTQIVDARTKNEEGLRSAEKIKASTALAWYEKVLRPRDSTLNSAKNETDSMRLSKLCGAIDMKENNNSLALFRRIKGEESNGVNEVLSAGLLFTKNEPVSDGNDDNARQVLKRSTRRRSVKNLISYTEPALNTKLRQGATFFPKMSDVNELKTTTYESAAKEEHSHNKSSNEKQQPTQKFRHELSSVLGTYWESTSSDLEKRNNKSIVDDPELKPTVVSPEPTAVI